MVYVNFLSVEIHDEQRTYFHVLLLWRANRCILPTEHPCKSHTIIMQQDLEWAHLNMISISYLQRAKSGFKFLLHMLQKSYLSPLQQGKFCCIGKYYLSAVNKCGDTECTHTEHSYQDAAHEWHDSLGFACKKAKNVQMEEIKRWARDTFTTMEIHVCQSDNDRILLIFIPSFSKQRWHVGGGQLQLKTHETAT